MACLFQYVVHVIGGLELCKVFSRDIFVEHAPAQAAMSYSIGLWRGKKQETRLISRLRHIHDSGE